MYQNWKAEYFLSLSQNHPKFPILKVFWINWSYIEKSEQNICACLSRHETNFGATLSGSTYLIPTLLYSNSFARNLLMFKSGCIFLHFTLHSPGLNFHLKKCCLQDTIQSHLFHFIFVDTIFCCCKNAVYETNEHFAIFLQIDNFILMPNQILQIDKVPCCNFHMLCFYQTIGHLWVILKGLGNFH